MTTILLATTALLGYLYYRFDKPATISFALGVVCIMAGAQVYSLGATITDLERLFGIFVILIGMLYAWEAFTSYQTGRTEDRRENLIEKLEELEDDLQDAEDQEDSVLAGKIRKEISAIKQYEQIFSTDTDSSNIRRKAMKKRQNRRWRKFDNEGTM